MAPRHLLLVRTSAFGDVVQTFYVLSDLHRALPETRIDWCVDERFIDLARLHPAVTKVISLPTRRWRGLMMYPRSWLEVFRWIKDLRALDIDASLDLQGLYKSALVGWISRARLRLGPEAFAESEPGVHCLYHRELKGSKVEGLAMRARYLAGVALGYDAFSYPIDSGTRRWTRTAYAFQILMMVGASRKEKMWPEAQWTELCGRVLRKVSNHDDRNGQVSMDINGEWAPVIELLWGSESERQIALSIEKKVADPRVLAAPRAYAINELIAKFLTARALVGGDTGLGHLAVALGLPTVMLFLKTQAARYAHPDLKHQLAVDITDGDVTVDRVIEKLNQAFYFGPN